MLIEHGFKLDNTLNDQLWVIFMTLYTESVADQTDHFLNAFVCEKLPMAITFWRRLKVYTRHPFVYRNPV